MAEYLPSLVCVVSYPAVLEPGQGRSRVNARHNKAVKLALKRALIYHQEQGKLKRHFQFGAHSRYHYHKRSEKTLLIKSRRGKRYLDLVMSGKAKRQFMSPANRKITIRGSTYGARRIVATMRMRWPPGYYDRNNAKPTTVTKKKMTDEIERFTEPEQKEMAKVFGQFYIEEMRKQFKEGGRVTKKFWSKLKSQGVY